MPVSKKAAEQQATGLPNKLLLKRARYRRRRDSNKCTICSKSAMSNKSLCEECATSNAIKKVERADAGMCTRIGCNNSPRPGMKRCDSCADKGAIDHRKLKQTILDHYGQVCNCPCGCRVTSFEWLTVDHVNNDGLHRQSGGKNSGHALYRQIINREFPDSFQILCWNCNCAKGHYGQCPGGQ